MERFFPYGEYEIAYLKSRDKRLGEVIDKVGMVKRRVIPDLFAALVHSIVGQQISAKAHETIWRKMTGALGEVSPEKVLGLSPEELQTFGITFRKVDYIRSAARKIVLGEFDIHALRIMSDAEVCAKLSELDGIGVWTTEMLMLHSLQRPDVLSFGDLAVQRGLRMLYHHRKITRPLFEKYRRRYSPYGSVACIYLWAVSAGAVEGLKDYAKVLGLSPEELQTFGITFRKVDYIRSAARKIVLGEFDIHALRIMSDAEVCAKLSELDGIGVWTTEMLMLHSLQRPDVLSFGDLAVQRGLRMLYHHRKITRPLFEKYRRRYSPYGSVACIYLWAVSAGAVEGLKDYAPKEKNDGRKRKNKGDFRP